MDQNKLWFQDSAAYLGKNLNTCKILPSGELSLKENLNVLLFQFFDQFVGFKACLLLSTIFATNIYWFCSLCLSYKAEQNIEVFLKPLTVCAIFFYFFYFITSIQIVTTQQPQYVFFFFFPSNELFYSESFKLRLV